MGTSGVEAGTSTSRYSTGSGRARRDTSLPYWSFCCTIDIETLIWLFLDHWKKNSLPYSTHLARIAYHSTPECSPVPVRPLSAPGNRLAPGPYIARTPHSPPCAPASWRRPSRKRSQTWSRTFLRRTHDAMRSDVDSANGRPECIPRRTGKMCRHRECV